MTDAHAVIELLARAPAVSMKVKGSVLKSRLAFVEEQAGAEGVLRVRARLSAASRRSWTGCFPAAGIPSRWAGRSTRPWSRSWAEGSPEFFLRLGAASAVRNLGGVHRAFLRPGDPHGFLAQSPEIYAFYYDRAAGSTSARARRKACFTTFESETFSATDCLTVVGWHTKALEMCGATGVRS